jgi:hypothetical protein
MISPLLLALLLGQQATPVYSFSGAMPAKGATCEGVRVGFNATSGEQYCCVSSVWTPCGSLNGTQMLVQKPSQWALNAVSLYDTTPGLLINNGEGLVATYLGSSCTNKFPRSTSVLGAWTCASVDLSTDTAATVLPMTKGGTGANLTGVAGGVHYSSSTTVTGQSAAGTNAFQVLHSGVAGAPTWSFLNVNSISTSNVASATNFLRGDGAWALPAGGSGLPGDPAACPAGQYVTDQDISGVLTCAAVKLDQIAAPVGDVSFTFPSAKKQTYTFTGNTDVAFSIDGDGAFTGTGDLVHVHKTGVGSAVGADAVHIEVTSDTNMIGMRMTMPSTASTAVNQLGSSFINGNVTATNFYGNHVGNVTGNVIGSANIIAPAGTTSQFWRGDNTWNTVSLAAHTPNQGTTTTVLHGNAAGQPTYASVNLLSDTTADLLSIAKGGTNSSATATTGGVGYGTGTAHAYTAAGTTSQVLIGSATAPTFGSVNMLSMTTADILSAAKGGTANGFHAVSGPTTSTKTMTLPDASFTIPTPVAGAVMYSSSTSVFAQTANPATGAILTGTAGGNPAWLADVAAGNVLVSGGASTIPAWSASATCTSSAATTCTITGRRAGCLPVCSMTTSVSTTFRAALATTTITCTFGTSGTNTCNCICF